MRKPRPPKPDDVDPVPRTRHKNSEPKNSGTKKARKAGPLVGARQLEFSIGGPIGTWYIEDDIQRDIINGFSEDTDRAVGVVAGAMIESRIEAAILARLRHKADVIDRLFRISGPLGSFSPKLDLAYAAGIISDAAHDDLVIMKDVRNRFAHDLSIKDFGTPIISDLVAKLKLIETLVVELPKAQGGLIMQMANKPGPRISVLHYEARKNIPRQRWLITTSLFQSCLAFAEGQVTGELI